MRFDEITCSRIIRDYETLEDEFIGFSRIVPYEKQNKTVWSPKLANIILPCGSLIDSIFRASVPKSGLRKLKAKKIEYLDIRNYQALFYKPFHLNKIKTMMYVSPPELLYPFKFWESANYKSPSWWVAYNKIKHDRLKYMHLATVENTTSALAGLFEIISQHPKMIKTLIRYKWLNTGDYYMDYFIPAAKKIKSGRNPALENTLLVETKLFVTTWGRTAFPDRIKDIAPSFFQGSDNLIRFLGKSISNYKD